MAALMKRRSCFLPQLLLSQLPRSRLLSTDALVEYKPGEIGFVSGIPNEHLRRRVFPLQFFCFSALHAYGGL
ncbi:hypothetical protein M5K25_001287 [Dendrobium thyrsiflorum]|uniref:Uncharacterized protein n=1 Tax=Dendrobium thyrsiflorum TaxID=117978 RepID=A0ABD0VR12_DENTH